MSVPGPILQWYNGIRSNDLLSLLFVIALILVFLITLTIIVNVAIARRRRNAPIVLKKKSGKYTGY